MDQILDIGFAPPVKPKVLVVDDENSLQTLIFDSLESDFDVIAALNGRQGLEVASRIKPDVILMDVMMPDMGGYDAVRLLNGKPETRSIPVIVMTAQDFDDSTIKLIRQESNVVGFLTKPFRPKTLRELLFSTIEKRKNPS